MKIGTNGEHLFKTLKLQNFYKMLGERCETSNNIIFQSSSKQFQSNISRYRDQTTTETSTITASGIFSPNLDGEGRGNFTNSELIKAATLEFCSFQ